MKLPFSKEAISQAVLRYQANIVLLLQLSSLHVAATIEKPFSSFDNPKIVRNMLKRAISCCFRAAQSYRDSLHICYSKTNDINE